jgi:deazaflavin-dependent oxidoreductase (nitroreductase family)
MGLAADLGYRHHTANPLYKPVLLFAGSRAGGWFFSRVLRHLDDLVGRLTRGRRSAPELLAGLAVLDVTTTGRRSGQRRTSHLIAAPYDDTLALLGTNFGQASTPAWALNLEAHPHATVRFRDATREVVARPATALESERIFASAASFYPGYAHYRKRVGDSRRIRVFVLEPAQEA